MAPELSSNWKKLQEKLKAPPKKSAPISQEELFKQETSKKSISSETLKRKASESKEADKAKKHKTQPPRKTLTPSNSKSATISSKDPKMGGNVQSKPITSTSSNTISPSLHLWASEEGISSESLAEAYNLGLRSHSSSSSHVPLLSTLPPAVPNAGLTLTLSGAATTTTQGQSSLNGNGNGTNGLPLPSSLADDTTTADLALILSATKQNTLGKYLSLDCEMVGTGPSGLTSLLARVSVVDFHLHQIYDSYVQPTAFVTDWRTPVSGITKRHMAIARPFESVQATVAALLKGRILVGHDVKHDLEVLGLEHPHRDIRDTAKYSGFRKYGHGPKPSLRVLAKEVLGVEIQRGEHSSVEDARVAMLLFRREKCGFDVENSKRYEKEEAGLERGKGNGRGKGGKGGGGGNGSGKKKKGKK
ncbi:ribonuclease H-like domain-containing protein [Pseudoneurospora amorphoporcata]|uniref:RNA exonuclease 4 n=1 Tax=Pseudoneurospora amorphoporcata TaxID=241081 RepID=A0AAN6NQ44_9PEZI|nr:ribonuclease H-like domain-containing protein [Pseudoneurospora amorphoporcata]